MSALESVLVMGIGLSAVSIKLEFKRVLSMGVVLFVLVNTIRFGYTKLHIPLGTHSFLILIVQVIIIMLMGKQAIYKSIIATLISYLVLIMLESVIVYNYFYIFDVSRAELNADYFMRSIILFISNTPLSIVFYLTYVKGFAILKQSKEVD